MENSEKSKLMEDIRNLLLPRNKDVFNELHTHIEDYLISYCKNVLSKDNFEYLLDGFEEKDSEIQSLNVLMLNDSSANAEVSLMLELDTELTEVDKSKSFYNSQIHDWDGTIETSNRKVFEFEIIANFDVEHTPPSGKEFAFVRLNRVLKLEILPNKSLL